jgi:hypothetical protein
MTRSYLIPRRTFLRGSGAAMALPLLEIMSPAVSRAADTTDRKDRLRMCVLYKGCGVNPNAWDITGGSETKFELSKLLAPLESHKRDITILRGIDSNLRANGGHVQATLAFMTGELKKSNFKQSVSFDQVIADAIGGSTPVKSLVLRGDPYIDQGDPSENYLSYDLQGNPLPAEPDPEVVFSRLFRGFDNAGYRAKTVSVLDQIKESYGAVAGKASARDKKTLEQYLESVRDVEKRIGQFQSSDDSVRQKRIAGIKEIAGGSHMGDRIHAMLDLIALAFWTNTTRVASLMMAHTESRGTYEFIGIKREFHALSHFVRWRGKIPQYDKVNRWHVGQLSGFLDKLKSYQDAEGTVLDNSVVLFGSGIKHGDYHSVADLPLILAGGCGGQIKLGRHVHYQHATNSNLLLKLMNIMGVNRKQFAGSTEPLPGITEMGTFRPEVVDDGSWKVQSVKGNQVVLKGLLKISVTDDDPNLYVLQLSDGTQREIRASFGNINGSKLDVYVGSVMTVTGRLKTAAGKQVITNVNRFEVQK